MNVVNISTLLDKVNHLIARPDSLPGRLLFAVYYPSSEKISATVGYRSWAFLEESQQRYTLREGWFSVPP